MFPGRSCEHTRPAFNKRISGFPDTHWGVEAGTTSLLYSLFSTGDSCLSPPLPKQWTCLRRLHAGFLFACCLASRCLPTPRWCSSSAHFSMEGVSFWCLFVKHYCYGDGWREHICKWCFISFCIFISDQWSMFPAMACSLFSVYRPWGVYNTMHHGIFHLQFSILNIQTKILNQCK